MKKTLYVSLLILLSSCEAIKGIFNAGIWTGVIFMVALVCLILFIIIKVINRNDNK